MPAALLLSFFWLISWPGTAQFSCPPLDLGPDATLCAGTSLTLDAGSGFNTYLWNTGETTQTITVNEPGVYTATVPDAAGCLLSDAVEVSAPSGDWTQATLQKVLAADGAAEEEFGRSVSVSGNIALVGAPEDKNGNGVGSGAARYGG